MPKTKDLTILTSPGAAEILGLGYIKAMVRDIDNNSKPPKDVSIDCGNNGALAYEAILLGFASVLFSGQTKVREQLISIANKMNTRILKGALFTNTIDLADHEDIYSTLIKLTSDLSE